MIVIRPATEADVKDLHPELAGVSYRAWAAEIDGEKAGVIGLALTRPRACLFCGFSEDLRPHLTSMPLMRLLKKVEMMFKARGLPVYALRDANEPKSEAILRRLGFKFSEEIDGSEVYEWRPD